MSCNGYAITCNAGRNCTRVLLASLFVVVIVSCRGGGDGVVATVGVIVDVVVHGHEVANIVVVIVHLFVLSVRSLAGWLTDLLADSASQPAIEPASKSASQPASQPASQQVSQLAKTPFPF